MTQRHEQEPDFSIPNAPMSPSEPKTAFSRQTRADLLNLRLLTKDDDFESWKRIWESDVSEEWHFGFIGMVHTNREEAVNALPTFVGRVGDESKKWNPDAAILELRSSFGRDQEGAARFYKAVHDNADYRITGVAERVTSWFKDVDTVKIYPLHLIRGGIVNMAEEYSPHVTTLKILKQRGFFIEFTNDPTVSADQSVEDNTYRGVEASLEARAACFLVSTSFGYRELETHARGFLSQYVYLSDLWDYPTQSQLLAWSREQYYKNFDPENPELERISRRMKTITPQEFYMLMEKVVDAKLEELKQLNNLQLQAKYDWALDQIAERLKLRFGRKYVTVHNPNIMCHAGA